MLLPLVFKTIWKVMVKSVVVIVQTIELAQAPYVEVLAKRRSILKNSCLMLNVI